MRRQIKAALILRRSAQDIQDAGSAPGISDAYTTSSQQNALVGNRIAEEEEFSHANDAQVKRDAKLYANELQREEKLARQAQVDEAPMHQDYVPATTWTGLEMVGGEKEWDTGEKFHGFLPAEKLETAEEITAAIYRAVVEIFAALSAGRTPRTSKFYKVGPLVNEAHQVKIEVTKADDVVGGGKVRLAYPSSAVEQAVLRAGSTTLSASTTGRSSIVHVEEDILADTVLDEVVETPSHIPESFDALINSWGRSWLHIPLEDPKLKFAVMKRVNRLTGISISDHVVHNTMSVAWLVSCMVKNKGSQKLFDTLDTDGNFKHVPNVRIMGRRETPVDKETQVGRWKLIEAELRRRDLPVLGRV